MKCTLLFPLLIAAVVAAVSDVRAESPEDVETWYVVRISGSVVGFASETVRQGDGQILYRSHTNLSLKRMGTPLSMFMMMEEETDGDGRFRRARMEMDASVTGMKTNAVLDGDSVRLSFESGGHTSTKVVAWEDDALSQYQAEETVEKWLAGEEDVLRYRVFSVDDGSFKIKRVERGESVVETRDGEERKLHSIREFDGEGDVPVSTSWFDEDNEAVRTVIAQMGMEITIERIEREEMASIEIEPNFDIIRQSMIPVEGYPDPPAGVEDVTMRLELSYAVSSERDFQGPNQKEVRRGEEWVEILISRETINRMTVPDGERDAFLAAGQYIQSDHASVVAIADSIRKANSGDEWAIATEISRWVHDWITGKNFEQGFASALEVLESREGDCTEHSMLLTALLRAAGIPARPAVGLAYSQGTLVGHMWSEAHVDYWRSLDALDLEGNPIRIRISGSSGSEAVDERDLVAAYAIAGGMTVRVVGYNLR